MMAILVISVIPRCFGAILISSLVNMIKRCGWSYLDIQVRESLLPIRGFLGLNECHERRAFATLNPPLFYLFS